MKLDQMLKNLEKYGFSDEKIARNSGVSIATISRIRREVIVNCRVDTAEKIRKVYEKYTNTKVENFL